MHADAAKLPGPLGLYEVPLRVRGVVGTLRRCEVSTVHTFLVFSAVGHPDVYVDLSLKQARPLACRPRTRARHSPSTPLNSASSAPTFWRITPNR